jgi:hypothetical protein
VEDFYVSATQGLFIMEYDQFSSSECDVNLHQYWIGLGIHSALTAG